MSFGQCIQYSSDISVPIHIQNKFIQNSYNENCPKCLNQVYLAESCMFVIADLYFQNLAV